jgi:hypothetical protein
MDTLWEARLPMFPNVDLIYGFNQPEPGFIWSQYRFGLRVDPKIRYCIVEFRYYGQQGTLVIGDNNVSTEFPLCRNRIKICGLPNFGACSNPEDTVSPPLPQSWDGLPVFPQPGILGSFMSMSQREFETAGTCRWVLMSKSRVSIEIQRIHQNT